MPDNRDLLFLFIPHIITDEFSARIIIDDLANAYMAIQAGQPISLPLATTPFSRWASQLKAFAASPELRQEFERFKQLPWNDVGRLPRAFPESANTYAHARDLCVALSKEETEQLLAYSHDIPAPPVSLLVASLRHWQQCRWASCIPLHSRRHDERGARFYV